LLRSFAARGALFMESVDAVETSVGGHGRIRFDPSFGTRGHDKIGAMAYAKLDET
jgi:hypothetical protein